MKIEYQAPVTKILDFVAETCMITNSLDGNPVPNAPEGDVSGWGIWS